MRIVYIIFILILLGSSVFAQTTALRGQVTDESGALVPGAKVTLVAADGVSKTAIADNQGRYSFPPLTPGNYTVSATAPDLATPQAAKLLLKPGPQTLNLQLKVASTTQQVTVEENAGPSVSTESSNNASALVLRGEDLQALSDDPDDLMADLQALAGPAAGPNGGSIFIDGFSGGELPPKESIREIRINQNPFSPEFDKLGFGRIEIFTKPGTDHYRGTVQYNYANDFWNSRNPYSAQKAPLLLQEFEGNTSGPLGKRASFTLGCAKESGGQRRHHQCRDGESADARHRAVLQRISDSTALHPLEPAPGLSTEPEQHLDIPLFGDEVRHQRHRYRRLRSCVARL